MKAFLTASLLTAGLVFSQISNAEDSGQPTSKPVQAAVMKNFKLSPATIKALAFTLNKGGGSVAKCSVIYEKPGWGALGRLFSNGSYYITKSSQKIDQSFGAEEVGLLHVKLQRMTIDNTECLLSPNPPVCEQITDKNNKSQLMIAGKPFSAKFSEGSDNDPTLNGTLNAFVDMGICQYSEAKRAQEWLESTVDKNGVPLINRLIEELNINQVIKFEEE